MRRVLWAGIGAATLAMTAGVAPAYSQDEKKPVRIEDAVGVALDRSPLVSQIEASLAAERAEAFETRTLPNPEFDADVAAPFSSRETRGSNELNVGLAQPFRLTHGRPRNRVASLIEAAGTAEKERELLGLVSRVRLAFAGTWVLSQRSEVLKQLLPQARDLGQLVATGLKEGAYGKGEGALFRAETFKIEALLKEVSAEKELALTELSRVTGVSFDGEGFLAPELPRIASQGELKDRLDQSGTKLQQRSKLVVELAQAAQDLARRDAFPALRPRLFYSRNDEGTEFVGLGMSVELPFWSRNTAERMRKDALVKAAVADRAFAESETLKEAVLRLAKSYDSRRDELSLHVDRILPATREALAAMEQQVRSGKGSVFQLWQTLREYNDTHAQYLERWADAFSAHAELSLLLEEDV